ncbi:MAG: HipA family kinase [Nitrososphaerales archaeon]
MKPEGRSQKNNMVNAIQFIEFLESASSRCFHVLGDDGNEWVVRSRKVGKNAKRLFNEYAAGNLATNYGLSRPSVSLVRILPGVLKHLDENIFDQSCTIGVGTQYIANLAKVPRPNVSFTSKEFLDANKQHLLAIFGSDYDFTHFYGHRLFSNWVLLEDYKYETLHISPGRIPVFLDLDLAFGGSGWDTLPNGHTFSRMPQYAAYCEGVTSDMSKFEPLFEKFRSIDQDEFDRLIASIPMGWDIPEGYADKLSSLLFGNIDHFIEEFKYNFELQKLGI